MEPEKHSSRSIPSVKDLIILWIIFGILGVIIGLSGYFISKLDYFVKWESFSAAPPSVDEILGGGPYQVFVRTASNEVLSCYPAYNECWLPAAYDPQGMEVPCNDNTAAFQTIPYPSEGIVDCVKMQGAQQGGGYSVQYVLDNQGTIWRWLKTTSEFESFLIPIFAFLGGVLGVIVASIIWVVRRLSAKRSVM